MHTSFCIGIQRQDTEGSKSVRFCVSPTEDRNLSNNSSMPPNILINQSTLSTDSTDSTSNLSSILSSHKRSNTVQPRRTQQSGNNTITRESWKRAKTSMNSCAIDFYIFCFIFITSGFDELRNVVRFLSFQADDNEDVENNDELGNGQIKEKEKVVMHENAPKRLEVAVDVVDNKDGGRRRSVRRSSFRNKEKKKRLQRLASMPGKNYNNKIQI